MTLEIAAQIIGIVAMFFNIFSYQQKSPIKVMSFQLLGCTLFAVNFFMLGAIGGGIMNLIGALRALIFMNKKKVHSDHIGWLIGFVLIYIVTYVLNFTLFGKEFTVVNALIEILPVIGMTVITVAFRLQNAKMIRLLGLVNSPCWLIYDVINFTIGGIICELFSLCSIIIGMIRHDFKRGKKKEAE